MPGELWPEVGERSDVVVEIPVELGLDGEPAWQRDSESWSNVKSGAR